MSAVQQFYEITRLLVDFLENKAPVDRDEKINKIDVLLEKRQEFMHAIIPPYSDEEKITGAKIVRLNEKVTALLAAEKLLIQQDLKNLSHKKESAGKYLNPYQNMSTDGMFYDKRK